jgi:hypothetical protein
MSDEMSGAVSTSEQVSTLSDIMVTSAKYLGKRGRNSRKPHTVRYWTDDGKQHEASYATDREAIDARDRMLANRTQPYSRLTFGEAFELWLAQHPVKESSRQHYLRIYRARLQGPLGERKLAQVARDPDTVESLANCEPGKVILLITCGVAAWAHRQGMITENRLMLHHATRDRAARPPARALLARAAVRIRRGQRLRAQVSIGHVVSPSGRWIARVLRKVYLGSMGGFNPAHGGGH